MGQNRDYTLRAGSDSASYPLDLQFPLQQLLSRQLRGEVGAGEQHAVPVRSRGRSRVRRRRRRPRVAASGRADTVSAAGGERRERGGTEHRGSPADCYGRPPASSYGAADDRRDPPQQHGAAVGGGAKVSDKPLTNVCVW